MGAFRRGGAGQGYNVYSHRDKKVVRWAPLP